MTKRRKFTSQFKKKVVLEALKERNSMSELAKKFDLHPQQITNWKAHFLTNAESVFEKEIPSKESEEDKLKDSLLKTIGEQKVEIDFLKKKLR